MNDSASKRVFVLVLAAGSASRFGTTKQLAELDGVALARRAVDIARDCRGNDVLLVVGHDWQAVRDACGANDGFMVVNDRHSEGLGGSIAQAARSVAHVAAAVLIVLADQALITAQHLTALCAAWNGGDDEIVATEFGAIAGAPALYGRACFDDLAALQGDSGARHLLDDARFTVRTVAFEDAAVDVDTPEDLRRILHSARS